jgi:hypothetical protein
MRRPLVTLTTDFGERDPYVAAMKGVILTLCPEAEILDLTHEIAPGSILEGSLFLAGALPYYPPGSIHVVVVDPGVGTKRHPMAARLAGRTVVGPDNGLITLVSRVLPVEEARGILDPRFMLDAVSNTFHGRDIFAPAAGRLAAGAAFKDVGPPLSEIQFLKIPQARKTEDGIKGQIIHVDRFGNLITNIGRELLEGRTDIRVKAGRMELSGLSLTYADAPPEEPLALIGGTNLVAVNQGNARTLLGLEPGDSIIITE